MSHWANTTSVISKCGTFSLLLFLAILFSVLWSNLIVLHAKSSREYPALILNVNLFSVYFYIFLLKDYQYFHCVF